MPYALLICRLLLTAVFAVAGSAKLADQAGSRQTVLAFGAPRWLAGPGGIVLPFAELVIAALLLPVATAWVSAIGALALLLAFLVVIGISLAHGRSPECHCFGQLHSAPAGWSVMARNVVLAGISGFIVWQGRYDPGPSVVAWLPDLTAAGWLRLAGGGLGLALLAVQSVLLLQVLNQQGRILLRLERLETGATSIAAPAAPAALALGLPIGTRAPSFRLSGLDRETITLEALAGAGKPVLLLFTNPHCGPCQALMPEIGDWQQEHSGRLTIVLVSEGTAAENRADSVAHRVKQVLLQRKREVAEAYQAWGTPGAVLIRPDGTIASSLAQGADAIRVMVAQAASGNGPVLPSAVAKAGDLVPPLKLHDLSGASVALNELEDETLVLFWNPGCGFCQKMLDDLKQWEADPPTGAPRLLLISAGNAEENRALGLRSRILLDQMMQAGPAFGANGTPMAVLIDAQGRVASEVAAGAQAVLALAGAKRSTRAPLGSAASLQAVMS